MLYLFQKNSIYYYKRKIPKTRKNIVFSLETDSFDKAKFMINSLNPILDDSFMSGFYKNLFLVNVSFS